MWGPLKNFRFLSSFLTGCAAHLCFWLCCWENSPNTARNELNFKTGSQPTKSGKCKKQTCLPPIWEDIGIKKWSPFPLFRHRKCLKAGFKPTLKFSSFWAVFRLFSQQQAKNTNVLRIRSKMETTYRHSISPIRSSI